MSMFRMCVLLHKYDNNNVIRVGIACAQIFDNILQRMQYRGNICVCVSQMLYNKIYLHLYIVSPLTLV